jgi:Permuted papain-like amidase enzyme, YaeF/YiiX, C92 family
MPMRLPAVALVLATALARPAAAEDLPSLQRGDVVFQNSLSDQSLAISIATGSEFTHVGIVDINPNGDIVVLEAVTTTRETPLEDWLTYGADADVAVYRFQDLTEDQALAVTTSARSHFGKPYDPYFHGSEDALYCSELVFIAFRDAIGVELGQTQRLRDLNLDNAAALALVGDRWSRHPSCMNGQAQDAAGCLALILDNPLITPVAQSLDARLQLIYSSFPM